MKKLLLSIVTILLSGVAFYFGNEFHAQWWLMWLAPIPLLIYMYRSNWWQSAIVVFLATFFLGLNDVIGYAVTRMPSGPFIVSALFYSLQLTVTFLIARWIMCRSNRPYSVFAFPVVFSLQEWLTSLTSQGTFSTWANSQLHFLAAAQLASVGGYILITFVMTLFAAGAAYFFVHIKERRASAGLGLLLAWGVVVIVLLLGAYRQNNLSSSGAIKVGMASVSRSPSYIENTNNATALLNSYLPLMSHLAKQGAQFIMIPEESFAVNHKNQFYIYQRLRNFAKKHKVYLIIGVRQKFHNQYNTALLISAQGKILGQYHKRHFVPGVEDGLTPGKKLLVFNYNGHKFGIAICRDMDYHNPANRYGKAGVNLLFVPAWDFDIDAAVHFQGAHMRSVENGFTLVRAARDGFLSVSNSAGRVLGKALATSHTGMSFMATAPIAQQPSWYAGHQYAFVILLWVMLLLLFV